MIVKLKWSKSLSVGIDKIDREHKELFSIVNDLLQIYHDKQGQEQILDVLYAMVQYAQEHFATEDEYMTAYGFPKFQDHRKEHTKYLERVGEFLERYEAGSQTLTTDMLVFLSQWWLEHTSEDDLAFGLWVKSRKKRSPQGAPAPGGTE